MTRERFAAALLFALAACSSSADPGDTADGTPDEDRDRAAPLLQVETPLRGTLSEGSTIIVTGTVSDENGVAGVKVNGTAAELSGDRFEASITVGGGMSLVQTIATDLAGNEATDIRAVLAGTFAPQGTPVDDAIVARIGEPEMQVFAGMIENLADNTDFGAYAAQQNPIAQTGSGCNNARIHVESITKNDVLVSAKPVSGGIDLDIRIKNPVVTGRIYFRAVCVNGSTGYTLWADELRVRAKVGLDVGAGGNLQVLTSNESATFSNFNMDVGALPGFVDDWAEGAAGNKLAEIIRDQVVGMAPPMAESYLSEFTAGSWNVRALGQTVQLQVAPTTVSFDAQGGTIVLQSNATLADVEGASYLVSPSPLPSASAMAGGGLRLGVADDVANQILAGFWASGALEQEIATSEGDPITATFGDQVDRVTVRLMLPPTLRADEASGAAHIAIGDLMVEIVDDDGGEGTLARFAISAEIGLRVETAADGRLSLVTEEPLIWAQVLEKSPALVLNINEKTVEALAGIVIDQIGDRADGLLESLPLPSLGGASLSQPTIASGAGYLLLGAQLD